jgi:hypothetical protein
VPTDASNRQRGVYLDDGRGDLADPADAMKRASNDPSTPGSIRPHKQAADDGRLMMDRRGRR